MTAAKVGTIEYHGTVYALPFASLFRALTASEAAELCESAVVVGIGHPVLVYDSESQGPNCVIDGANRLRTATELNIDCPVKELYVDDETARRMAEDLNIARRHVTVGEARAVRQTRQERQQRIKEELKKNPVRSDNGIAEQLGVSDKTVGSVRRDLIACSEIPNTPTRTDASGRKQPARKPKVRAGSSCPTPEKVARRRLLRELFT